MTSKLLAGVRVEAASGAPDHLRVFRDRMAEAGIRVKIPRNKAAHKAPEPVRVAGTPLSELIAKGR